MSGILFFIFTSCHPLNQMRLNQAITKVIIKTLILIQCIDKLLHVAEQNIINVKLKWNHFRSYRYNHRNISLLSQKGHCWKSPPPPKVDPCCGPTNHANLTHLFVCKIWTVKKFILKMFPFNWLQNCVYNGVLEHVYNVSKTPFHDVNVRGQCQEHSFHV